MFSIKWILFCLKSVWNFKKIYLLYGYFMSQDYDSRKTTKVLFIQP